MTSSTPGVWLTNLYGPRPIGCFLKPSGPTCSTYFFGTTQPAPETAVPKNAMKSGHGSLSWNRTRYGEGLETSFTLSFRTFEPLARAKLNFTSSAVNGSPLWNFRPSRSLNSYVRWSALTVHDSARLGAMRLPGIGFTSASWRA